MKFYSYDYVLSQISQQNGQLIIVQMGDENLSILS